MGRFKIFVINLDDSTARLERLKSEAERIGVDFERIPAVDGRKLKETQILEHYSPELNRKKYYVPLSKPEIGVYMSHLKSCKKIISDNLDFGIILEDDIVLKNGFQLVPHILSALSIKWDYIKLIAPGKKKRIKDKIQIPTDVATIKINGTKDTPAKFELITWNKPPIGASAYAITRDGAKEFLSEHSIFFRPIDVDLQYKWETSLNIQGLSPFMLELLGDKSTVQTHNLKYHYPLARVLYKIKYALLSTFFFLRKRNR